MAMTRQPQSSVQIDPKGFARNAALLWVGSSPFVDLARFTAIGYSGYNNGFYAQGKAAYSSGTAGNNDYIEFANNSSNGAGGAKTVFLWTKTVVVSSTIYDSAFGNEGTNNSCGLGLWGNPGANRNKPYFEVFDNSNVQSYTTIQNQTALSTTDFTLLVGVATPANLSLYQNGTLVSQSNLVGSLPSANSLAWRIGRRTGASNTGASQIVLLAGVVNEARSEGEVKAFVNDPYGRLFLSQRRVWSYFAPPAAGGGTTWNDSVTEIASAADTQTAVSTRLADTAEIASAADTQTAVSTRLADTAETASAADTPTAVSTRLADTAEIASAADTPDATTGATPGVVAETASASDTPSAVSTRLADAAETTSAADTPTAVSTRLASVAETGSGAESTDGVVVPAGANVCSEVASAADTVSCVIVTAGSIAEGTASATDVCSAVCIWSAFVAETASAVDRPAVAGEVAEPAASRTWMIPFEDRTLYVYQDNQ